MAAQTTLTTLRHHFDHQQPIFFKKLLFELVEESLEPLSISKNLHFSSFDVIYTLFYQTIYHLTYTPSHDENQIAVIGSFKPYWKLNHSYFMTIWISITIQLAKLFSDRYITPNLALKLARIHVNNFTNVLHDKVSIEKIIFAREERMKAFYDFILNLYDDKSLISIKPEISPVFYDIPLLNIDLRIVIALIAINKTNPNYKVFAYILKISPEIATKTYCRIYIKSAKQIQIAWRTYQIKKLKQTIARICYHKNIAPTLARTIYEHSQTTTA